MSRGGGLLRINRLLLLLLLGLLGLLGLRQRLLLLLGRWLLGYRCQLGWLGGCGGGENSSLLSFCRVVCGGDELRRTIRQGDDLLARAGKDDVGSWCGNVLRLVLDKHLLLLLLGLLNDGWLSYDRGLNDFGELRSLRANLDLAWGNGGYRGDGSCPWTRGCFWCARTIVADSGHVLGVLRHRLLLLLRGDGDRRLWNLRILRFGYD